MGCGCKKNKTQQTQQIQPKTNTEKVQESINKTVEKYYSKNNNG